MIEFADCQEEMTREERIAAAAPELLAALKKVVRCLDEHIKQEAVNEKIPIEELCPCSTIELANARAAIARAEGVR